MIREHLEQRGTLPVGVSGKKVAQVRKCLLEDFDRLGRADMSSLSAGEAAFFSMPSLRKWHRRSQRRTKIIRMIAVCDDFLATSLSLGVNSR